GGDAVLQIETGARDVGGAVAVRIAPVYLQVFGAECSVRQDLGAPARLEAAQSLQVPVACDAAAHALRRERENGDLLLRDHAAGQLDTPRLQLRRTEAELTEGDAQLRRPALLIDGRRDVPHRIPRRSTRH